MTGLTYSRRLPHHLRTIATLVLAIAFVFSQSVAQQHIHVDGELTANCVVCHHADNSPSLLAKASVATPAALPTSTTEFNRVATHVARPVHDQQSRAPPATG